jgi:hypothetical protein
VRAVLEDVEFNGHFVLAAGHGEEEAVLHGDGAIVGGVEDEAGGRLGGHLPVVGKQQFQGGIGIVAEEIFAG